LKILLARFGVCLAATVAFAVPTHSQDVSVPTSELGRHVEMQGLAGDISTLQAKVTSATTRLFKIKECHTKGYLFRTLADGTEGCQAVVPCQLPWGTILGVGESAVAYQTATVPYGSACASENRTCNQSTGTLSGSFQNQTCAVGPAPTQPCNLPWGGQLADGGGIMAYAAPSVPYGESCSGEGRYCTNGALSGSYQYDSCSAAADPLAGCTYQGQGYNRTLNRTLLEYICPQPNVPGYTCTLQPRTQAYYVCIQN
jgi:hypothetical protein